MKDIRLKINKEIMKIKEKYNLKEIFFVAHSPKLPHNGIYNIY